MRLARRRDPAPSRLSYRIQRLALSPLIRRAIVWGLPAAAIATAAALWLGDAERREVLVGFAADFRRQLEERPEFMVQVVAIDGASNPLAGEIRKALGLRLPVSSFDLDLESLRLKVAAFDPVAEARVYVRPGGVLQVEVTEREPAIILRGAQDLVLLDAAGNRVRPLSHRDDRADLPLIAGQGAARAVPEALDLARAAQPLAERLAGFVRVGERRWDVVLDQGQRVLLPESGAVSALDQAIALDRAQDLLAREVSIVDLRNPRRPTLRMSEAAMDRLEAHRIEARDQE